MGSRFLCWIGLLLATIAGQAQAGFLNGSFENGLTGWQTAVTGAGTVNAVPSYSSYNPVQGAFFAQITGGTADVYQTLSQTFTASAGETLKGSAFFMTLDYLPFNDDGYVRLTLGNEIRTCLPGQSINVARFS